MDPSHRKFALRIKRFIVDSILEPLIPQRRLEAWIVFWARLVFRAHRPFVIGITGSVGKSTTTAMVASVLSHRNAERIVGPIGHTFGNMNDDLGVSATLLRFDYVLELPWNYFHRLLLMCSLPFRALRVMAQRYPKVMVLEYGVGPTADFSRMVTIAPPNVAVVTRIGAAHLEKLKTIEGVVQEKGKLVRAAPPSGLVILGQDHDYVSELELMACAPVVKLSGPGLELSQNIARTVGRYMGVPDDVINAVLSEFKIPESRLNRLEFRTMTVIDDSYNANPLSMKLGLDTLAQSVTSKENRRVAVLGGMGELGVDAPRYHEEVGAYARGRADILIGIGELAKYYHPDYWFENSNTCADAIERLLLAGDCLLVKGSASAKMGPLVKKLCDIGEKRRTAALAELPAPLTSQ